VRDGVDWGRVHDGDSVPARLDLDREMVLETTAGFGMVEDLLEGGVLEKDGQGRTTEGGLEVK
jgi:hypothetical protein